MNTLMNRIADRTLRLVLPEASAGACIPGVGTTCKCVWYDSCEPNNGDAAYHLYTYACNGTCVLHRSGCLFCTVGT